MINITLLTSIHQSFDDTKCEYEEEHVNVKRIKIIYYKNKHQCNVDDDKQNKGMNHNCHWYRFLFSYFSSTWLDIKKMKDTLNCCLKKVIIILNEVDLKCVSAEVGNDRIKEREKFVTFFREIFLLRFHHRA